MTKLQTAILGAVIVAGVAAPLVIHNRTQIKALTDGSASLRQRVDQLTGLASALEQENHRLSNLVAQANSPQLLANADLDELLRLRGEVGVLRQQAAKVQSAATTSELVLKAIAEDQTGLRAQFPDAFGAEMRYSAATNAGTATPVAALQTWLWTQRTGDADGLLNLWDFPPGTTEEQKLAAVREVQKTNADHRRNVEYAMQHPGLGGEGNFETFKLWGLYPLGNDYYLGVINEQDPHLISAAQTVVYHLVGNEWKVYRPAPRDVPPL